jgi:hypothetical protein
MGSRWIIRRAVLLFLMLMFGFSVHSSVEQFMLSRTAVEVAEEERSGVYLPAVRICGFVSMEKASTAKFVVGAKQTFIMDKNP